jgi:CubicO group peptidase (beta-lactamase class C family)
MCALDEFIEQKIVNGYFPGCVVLIGDREKTLFCKGYGFAMLEPEMRRTDRTTLFDIASLTKPVATATSVLLLKERGLVSLEEPASSVLPELKGTGSETVTISQLLTHDSGIPSWFPLYLAAKTDEEIIRFIGTMERGLPVYSCLDYILLGKLVERVTGKTLKEFSEQEIFTPLGMEESRFAPLRILRESTAATEQGNTHERALSRKYRIDDSFRWREEMIVGEVHDGNSYYCFGGISGNAGLFSTADDLARFARLLLSGGNAILNRALVEQFFEAKAVVEGESRSTGFVVGGEGSGLLSERTIWHTGFTGCAFWIDPEYDIYIIFLSNSVHPVVKPNILRSVRPLIIYLCLDFIQKHC